MDTIDSTATEVVESGRERTAVYQHPDRDSIEHLLRRGKSAYWISLWLEERYPVDDPDDDESDDAGVDAWEVEQLDQGKVPSRLRTHEPGLEGFTPTVGQAHPLNRRLQLSESAVEGYRARFLPEALSGVDVVSEDLEDMIGRKFPGAQRWELEIIEAGVHVAQANVALALKTDAEMKMLQQTTLEANKEMISAAKELVAVKQRLGLPGYEPMPEHIITENTNKNFSVELHGRVDPKTGRVAPGQPERIALAKALLEAPADQRAEIMAAAEAAARDEPERRYS